MKEDDMGRTCNTQDQKEIYTKYRTEILKGRDHVEDLCINEKITLKPMA
jgi:hypothetical protein